MAIRVKNTFNAKLIEKQVKAAIGVYANTAAKKMEGQAKRDGPWIDRTSNARNSILGNFGWRGSKAIITLSANMAYSPYLELAREKKYAVLVPTIQKNAPSILQGYKKVVG